MEKKKKLFMEIFFHKNKLETKKRVSRYMNIVTTKLYMSQSFCQ